MEDKEKSKLLELRQETFAKMESELNKWVPKKEDRLFYHHPSEDHVVLSHAMFWVMSGDIRGKINKDKYFCLLRKYQERMLDAYLMDSEDFEEQLHFCTVLYEMLPIILRELYKLYEEKEVNDHGIRETRRIAVVNNALCQGCGACTVACPSGAMDLQGFSNRQIIAEVDAICR